MDNDGTGIDTYTEVIPPDMVITYASDDDSNIEIYSDSDYEPEDDDDDVLVAKKLTGGASIMQDWDKLNMKVLWSKQVFVIRYTMDGRCYITLFMDTTRRLKKNHVRK